MVRSRLLRRESELSPRTDEADNSFDEWITGIDWFRVEDIDWVRKITSSTRSGRKLILNRALGKVIVQLHTLITTRLQRVDRCRKFAIPHTVLDIRETRGDTLERLVLYIKHKSEA